VFKRESAFEAVHAVVHCFDEEALGPKAFRQQAAELNIIIDDENAIHLRSHFPLSSMVVQLEFALDAFTNLYSALPILTALTSEHC